MNNPLAKVITIFSLIFMFFVVCMILLDHGLKKFERQECENWKRQKEEIPNWYASDWQKEQCKFYEIDL